MDRVPPASGDILIYNDPKGNIRVGVHVLDDTIWLTQQQIADIFQTTLQNVRLHIDNVYAEEELKEADTRRKLVVERHEGNRLVKREIEHFNLDLIISVGYRIKGTVATRFRQWATIRLREYLIKGFTMDDERLKNPDQQVGQDHFDELLQRIREIRASEKRAYQQIRDIFKLASDYDVSDAATNKFFAKMQNLMHYAVTGMTAAEIVNSRANAEKANMGLTSWKGSRIRKDDVAVAKNYMDDNELDGLNRIVAMFLDFAENRARRRQHTYMSDWEERLVAFLEFNEMEILEGNGKVTAAVAKALAHEEYAAFDEVRKQNEALTEDLDDLAVITETIESVSKEEPT